MFKANLILFSLSVLISGCANLPQDQHGATAQIRQSGIIVVGISPKSENATPFEERERYLAQKIAARLGAKIEWRTGNTHRLLEDLEELKLPLVAAAIPCDTPFANRIGLSKPYFKDETRGEKYCLAIAPGENRLLLLADEIIAEEENRNPQ